MDFKSLLSKLDSMEAPASTPAAPKLDKAVQLNEDAQLRVLAGTSSYVSEAKKKAEEKKEDKVDEATKTDKPWTDMKGNKHPGTAVKGDKYQGKEAEAEDKKEKKSKKDESIDPAAFKSKFDKMVEAKKGSKPDFLDMDKDGDKKEPMKSAAKDAKKGAAPKKGVNPFAKKEKVDEVSDATLKSYKDKADKEVSDHLTGEKDSKNVMKRWKGADKADAKLSKVKESEEKRAPAKKSEREVELPSGAKVKATKVQGWQSQKADKEAGKEKNESAMMPKGKKRPVKESVETKLSFKEMIKLVQESGGQQQIDAVDHELFAWAQRVAKSKFNESMKSEVYAGMVYERMGGKFEMFDILSEDQK
jgi:hypothetical protein